MSQTGQLAEALKSQDCADIDAQCDKLLTVVGRTRLTTLQRERRAVANVFSKSRNCNKVPKFYISGEEASVPKTSSVRPAVSVDM